MTDWEPDAGIESSPYFSLVNTLPLVWKASSVGPHRLSLHTFPTSKTTSAKDGSLCFRPQTLPRAEGEEFCYPCSTMLFGEETYHTTTQISLSPLKTCSRWHFRDGMVPAVHPSQQQILLSENCSVALSLKQLLQRGLSILASNHDVYFLFFGRYFIFYMEVNSENSNDTVHSSLPWL